MAYYPAFLDLRGRAALVVGGGEVGTRKALALARAGARVTVVGEDPTDELLEISGRGAVTVEKRRYRPDDLRGYDLAVAATDDLAVQDAVAEEARREKVWLNVVDVPERCDFIVPAVLERGSLQIAVSTSGTAPALAAAIRDRIAADLGEDYDVVVDFHRRVRQRLKGEIRSLADRGRILRALADSGIDDPVRRGDGPAVDRLLESVVGTGFSLRSLGVELPAPRAPTG